MGNVNYGLGRNVERERMNRIADGIPAGEVLGTVAETHTAPGPQGAHTTWSGPSGVVDLEECPPPWELGSLDKAQSDARRYVDVPDNWTLYWINPKFLESSGWRYWQPVMTSHPLVKVKVQQMASPDGHIRRGGHTGDILAWMYTSWVDKLREEHGKKTRRQTQAAVNRQRQLKEDFARGEFGPNLHLDAITHPSHTMAEGKSLSD